MDREIYIMALLEIAEKTQGNPEAYQAASQSLIQEMKKPQEDPIPKIKPSPFRER